MKPLLSDELINNYIEMDSNLTSDSKKPQFAINIMDKVNELIIEEEKMIEEKPDEAYTNLLMIVNYVNATSVKNPHILGHLEKLINELKRLLEKIADKVNAESYSIGVSAPFGIAVNITFKIKE